MCKDKTYKFVVPVNCGYRDYDPARKVGTYYEVYMCCHGCGRTLEQRRRNFPREKVTAQQQYFLMKFSEIDRPAMLKDQDLENVSKRSDVLEQLISDAPIIIDV